MRLSTEFVDQLADAGPCEHDLGEHSAREQVADADAEQGDGRQDRHRQRVAVDDPPLRQAERARGADVVLAHHLEHRGAHQARDVADPAEPDRERRQDQMAQLIAEIARLARTDRRQPSQGDREDQQRVERYHERRHRDRADGDHPDRPVDPAAAMGRREAAEHDAERDRPAEAERGQGERVRQGLEDDRRDAPVRPDVDPEIAPEHTADEVHELHWYRLVEAHARDQLCLHLGRGARPERDARRIARHQVDHAEQHGHRDQHDHQASPMRLTL